MQADTLLADNVFDADQRVIQPLLAAGKTARHSAQAQPQDPASFRQGHLQGRHLIENFYCRLKQFRAIATRYDKTARNFLAAIHLAAAMVWLN
jgi:transposase